MTKRQTEDNGELLSEKATDLWASAPGVVDEKLEGEGEWFSHAPLDRVEPLRNEIDGFRDRLIDANGNGLRRLFVRSRHCDEYQKALKRVNRTALRMPEKQRELYMEEMLPTLQATYCLLDWEFTAPDGSEVEYTVELGKQMLSEKRLRRYANFFWACILTHEGEFNSAVEADRGN